MFKHKAPKTISCVTHLGGDVVQNSHRKVVKKARRGCSPKVVEVVNEAECDTGNDLNEFNRHGRGKPSHLHRNWSKLKKCLGGNGGNNPSSDRDYEYKQNISSVTKSFVGEVEIAKPSKVVVQNKKDHEKSIECNRSTLVFEKNVELTVGSGSSKLPERNSQDNVKRWLMIHHQDSQKTKVHKSRKHGHHCIEREALETEVFESLHQHHHGHVTHRKRLPSHNSPERGASPSSIPPVNLNQSPGPQKSAKRDTHTEQLMNKLSPSLAHFMAELISNLESVQRSRTTEAGESKTMTHMCSQASTVKNTSKVTRCFSDSSLKHKMPMEDRSFKPSTQKFSTSTPKEKENRSGAKTRLDKVFDSPLNTRCNASQQAEPGVFTIGQSAVASLGSDTLKLQFNKKELTYNFLKDAKELIKGMRDLQKSALSEQGDIFDVYEFIVDAQSRVIRELCRELKHQKQNISKAEGGAG